MCIFVVIENILEACTSNDVCASIVSAARSLTCRDDLDSKWRLLLAENYNLWYLLHIHFNSASVCVCTSESYTIVC